VVPSGAEKHQVEESRPTWLKQPQMGSVTAGPLRHPFVTSNSIPEKVTGACVAPSGGVQTKLASGVERPVVSGVLRASVLDPLSSRRVLASVFAPLSPLIAPLQPMSAARSTVASGRQRPIARP
jgi:hypothetical protein